MKGSRLQTFLLGGILPIVAYTIIEEWKGPLWGTIAGLALGAIEILYEWRTEGKVSQVTLISNFFVFTLGLVSIFTQDGIWFRLQPALLVLAMAGMCFVTSLQKKPLLVALSLKQNPNLPLVLVEFLSGLNLRLGIFFLGLTGLSVYAAIFWSTPAWAMLKGLGSPLLMMAYLALEVLMFWLRQKNTGGMFAKHPPPSAQTLNNNASIERDKSTPN